MLLVTHMNQKGFANIVLILIVIILAGVLWYMLLVQAPESTEKLQSNDPQNEQSATSSLPDQTAKPVQPPRDQPVTMSQDNTSGWKTYHSKSGYQVKYPQDWSLKEIVSGIINFSDKINLSVFSGNGNNGNNELFLSKYNGLEEYLKWFLPRLKGENLPQDKLLINGIPMTVVRFSSDRWPQATGNSNCLGSDTWYFEKGGYIYRFMYLPGQMCIRPAEKNNRDAGQKIMEEMIRTFQFGK